MTVQATGAISLANIQTEFGGSNPIGLSEYYRGGSYVPSNVTAVPTSGAISLSQFYGTTAWPGPRVLSHGTWSTVNAAGFANNDVLLNIDTNASTPSGWTDYPLGTSTLTLSFKRSNGTESTPSKTTGVFLNVRGASTGDNVFYSVGSLVEDINTGSPYDPAASNAAVTAYSATATTAYTLFICFAYGYAGSVEMDFSASFANPSETLVGSDASYSSYTGNSCCWVHHAAGSGSFNVGFDVTSDGTRSIARAIIFGMRP